MELCLPIKSSETILALGAESSGGFCVLNNGEVYLSDDYGDLLKLENYTHYISAIESYLAQKVLKPKVIVCDKHPEYVTSKLAADLAIKYGAKLRAVQHHYAHIFSAVGEHFVRDGELPDRFIGIGADGTGLGNDGTIWGGEVFDIRIKDQALKIKRMGHLETQLLIGGDLAVKEPARILIAILAKFLSKDEIYKYVKGYYQENTFNLLWSQLEQRFNCFETSSTGRILDAASLLLGYCGNERKYKHEPIESLEINSGEPLPLEPLITIYSHSTQETQGGALGEIILNTTHLFKYLIDNLTKNRQRLAATAQAYIAQGLYNIATKEGVLPTYFAGGMANNKIISTYLELKGVITNKKIPRGDAGISFGQIIYALLADSRN